MPISRLILSQACRTVEWSRPPNSAPMRYLRQQRYYAEANAHMGITRSISPRLAVASLTVAVGILSGSVITCAAFLSAVIFIDFGRLHVKGVRVTPGAYLFWKWLIPFIAISGTLKGWMDRMRRTVTRPAMDKVAVAIYLGRPERGTNHLSAFSDKQ